ncbi:MAG: hypothetical protein JST30_10815 [Armatimonadetes bacterium]|nr:hypothetical protein [Armatimonadota bacterium]
MIPPPDRVCPKCGNSIPIGNASCSVCGWGRTTGGLVALWVVLLVLVGLPAGLMGGCFLLLAGLSAGTSPTRTDAVWTVLSLLGILLPVFFIVMIVRSGKK